MSGWQCKHCGHVNDVRDRQSFCGRCFVGRTQAIEDQLADKVGLPRHVVVKRQGVRNG